MGKPTGFLEYTRELPPKEDVQARVKSYTEFEHTFPEDKTKEQAARCMDCGVPFCHSGCPLGNKIPDFNDAVYNQEWEEAWQILKSTNNFPEFTGRICPAPCEGSCVLGINQPPVTIEHIEKSIAEKGFELGLEKVRKPSTSTGRKVAIVGSGPAGLAAADQLNQSGHSVTVFERDEAVGGLLRYGIPDFKLEKQIVERRVSILEKEGITFETKVNVGFDITAKELDKSFDAIVLCGGSTIPRDLGIPGRNLKGVHFAMEFLTQQNREVATGQSPKNKISAEGKDVVVIGGGDTGSDCVGTSNRQGAKSITQIEIMDKPPLERPEDNPWPEWPMVLRTSTSHEEGCDRKWAIMTKEFMGKKGQLTGLKVVEVSFENGKMKERPGSEQIIPAQLALIAAGFVHPQKEGLLSQLKLELDSRGNVSTKNFQSSSKKVFAAGDMRRGQSLVVWAIAEGRKAAEAVNKFLNA
ncbi:glutamate synthase (NADH) small subunit [Ekhidna lutea]|uniref:Glutamate synthase (NADH) small subunit n=1 Tax=Ekhidna lutea TaxID=447679 RepID=A0A239FDE4_EKHLU|nr:glutamate synthase subunit beta [Ekhidna lutea]SNS54857.1 glutamate synthase (NADH) small subunit [Ekhidna lutea]